jgi:WD40 repeat protein
MERGEFKLPSAIRDVSVDATGRNCVLSTRDGLTLLTLSTSIDVVRRIDGSTYSSLRYAPHTRIASQFMACSSAAVELWDAAASEPIRTLDHAATAVDWSPFDPHLVATSGVRIWDLRRKEPVSALPSPAKTVLFSKQHPYWLATAGGREVRILDTRTMQPLYLLVPHMQETLSLDWCAYNQHLLLTSGGEGKAKIWDVRDADTPLATIVAPEPGPVSAVRFTPFGLGFAAACGRMVAVYGLRAVREPTLLTDDMLHARGVAGLHFVHGGHKLLSYGRDGGVRLSAVDDATIEACGTSRKVELVQPTKAPFAGLLRDEALKRREEDREEDKERSKKQLATQSQSQSQSHSQQPQQQVEAQPLATDVANQSDNSNENEEEEEMQMYPSLEEELQVVLPRFPDVSMEPRPSLSLSLSQSAARTIVLRIRGHGVTCRLEASFPKTYPSAAPGSAPKFMLLSTEPSLPHAQRTRLVSSATKAARTATDLGRCCLTVCLRQIVADLAPSTLTSAASSSSLASLSTSTPATPTPSLTTPASPLAFPPPSSQATQSQSQIQLIESQSQPQPQSQSQLQPQGAKSVSAVSPQGNSADYKVPSPRLAGASFWAGSRLVRFESSSSVGLLQTKTYQEFLSVRGEQVKSQMEASRVRQAEFQPSQIVDLETYFTTTFAYAASASSSFSAMQSPLPPTSASSSSSSSSSTSSVSVSTAAPGAGAASTSTSTTGGGSSSSATNTTTVGTAAGTMSGGATSANVATANASGALAPRNSNNSNSTFALRRSSTGGASAQQGKDDDHVEILFVPVFEADALLTRYSVDDADANWAAARALHIAHAAELWKAASSVLCGVRSLPQRFGAVHGGLLRYVLARLEAVLLRRDVVTAAVFVCWCARQPHLREVARRLAGDPFIAAVAAQGLAVCAMRRCYTLSAQLRKHFAGGVDASEFVHDFCTHQSRCVVCHLQPRGLVLYCPHCAHGGHLGHVMEWFQRQTHCAVLGCDCECARRLDAPPLPSTSGAHHGYASGIRASSSLPFALNEVASSNSGMPNAIIGSSSGGGGSSSTSSSQNSRLQIRVPPAQEEMRASNMGRRTASEDSFLVTT